MGKIKQYRGRRTDNKEWIYGMIFYDIHGCYISNNPILNDSMNYDFIEIDSLTVGQQIGKQDKKGVDIYEGDNVRFYYEELFFQGNVSGTVIWDDDGCCWIIECDSVSMPIFVLDSEETEYEIVNTVYDEHNVQQA